MTMTETRYEVSARENRGLRTAFDVAVHFRHFDGMEPYRFVDSSQLGCSRDYKVADDVSAIRAFLAEHGMMFIGIKRTMSETSARRVS
jgi:hypothetical protein